jgi:uncharacterized membrane protein
MSQPTLYLARAVGLFCFLLCAALAVRPRTSVLALKEIADSPGLLLLTGVVTMAAGAALVVGHSIWAGGALTLIVTVLGWAILIKGLVLIALPSSRLAALYRVLHYPAAFRLTMVVAAVLSLGLVWLALRA